jgi:LPS-assembly lipoprotein
MMFQKEMKTLVVTVLALGVSACGFTPLYQESEANFRESLAGISVQPISEPANVGYQLEQELAKRVTSEKGVQYDLKIDLKETKQSVALTSADRTTRFNYVLTAKYVLTDVATGEKYNNSKYVVTSYGVVPSHYASLVGEEDATRKAAIELANKIELDLVLYFKSGYQTPEEVPVEDFDPLDPQ